MSVPTLSSRTLAHLKGMAVPVIAGVTVFGAVTAFAATLTIGGTSLAAGTGSVSACNASANVTWSTAYSSTIPGYRVSGAAVTSHANCNGKSYSVTLYDGTNAAITGSPYTGTLDASGNATVTIGGNVNANTVAGVSVVIAG